MIRRLAALAGLLSLALTAPAMAQNIVVKDANGANQTLCAILSTTLYPCNVVYGLFSGSPKAWTLDTNGYGGVNVQNTVTIGPIPTGGNTIGSIANTSFGSTSVVTAPQVNPTVSTSAYVSGYVLGGVLSFTVPASGIIQNAAISYASGTMTGQVDLLIFNANPTGGGTTDHAAVAIVAADQGKQIATIHVNDCTLVAASRSNCQALATSVSYSLPSGTTLYAVPVVRSAPTFTSSNDVKVTLDILQ